MAGEISIRSDLDPIEMESKWGDQPVKYAWANRSVERVMDWVKPLE
jgi:hypothetical protein